MRPFVLGAKVNPLGCSRPLQRVIVDFAAGLGSTVGTMPPSVSMTMGWDTPGPPGYATPALPASNIASAWPNVIRWIVLSPIPTP